MIDDKVFIEIVTNSKSMAEAATKLNISFSTLKRRAQKLGCYIPNQGGKGYNKSRSDSIKTEDILSGKYPNYQTYKLKKRLINEGYFEDRCQLCNWAEKLPNAKYTPCELHHKDENPHNHTLSNLILICPNCHSITETYRFRKRAHK